MFSFGASASDIVALVNLTYKLCKAFKLSGGAAEQYEAARTYLQSINTCLSTLESVSETFGENEESQALKGQLEIARTDWNALKDYLAKYEGHLDVSNSRGRPKRIYKTTEWTMKELEGRVEKLKSAISQSLVPIILMLLANHITHMDQVSNELLEHVKRRGHTGDTQLQECPKPGPLASIPPLCWESKAGCLCRCHKTQFASGRFMFLRSYGSFTVFQTCNVPSCNSRKYGFSFRVALSQFCVPLAINIALELQTGSFGFRPGASLKCQRIVPYTSAGFVIIDQLRSGPLLKSVHYATLDFDSLREARKSAAKRKLNDFKRLFDDGTCSVADVDPEGTTYLEEVIRAPWGSFDKSIDGSMGLIQLKLIEFLARRSPRDIENNPRLLYRCAKWIGEGPHLDLLDSLLTLGLNPGMTDMNLFQQWPRFSSPGWLSESMTPDPFMLCFLGECLEADSDFAGCSELFMPLRGAEGRKKVEDKCRKDPRALDRPNALGQTSVHFAVRWPQQLEVLLKAGANPDTVDKDGCTPLMYAAAYGESESVICLLRFDADPTVRSHEYQRLFLDYAVKRNHQTLILDTVQYLRDIGQTELALDMLDCCAFYHLVNGTDRWESDMLGVLLRAGADPDVQVGTGTLMHLIAYEEQGLQILAAPYEFTFVNRQDPQGITPTMHILKSTRTASPKMVKPLIERGVTTNMRDIKGWTAVMHLVKTATAFTPRGCDSPSLEYAEDRAKLVACLFMLLQAGADASMHDHCVCPCSDIGCSAMTIALNTTFQRTKEFDNPKNLSAFVVDLLCCLEVYNLVAYTSSVEDIHRFSLFQRTGLSHTCCLGRRHEFEYPMDGSLRSHESTSEAERAMIMAFEEDLKSQKYSCLTINDKLERGLASFYTHVEAISQQRHSSAVLRESANKRQTTCSSPDIDVVNDTISRTLYVPVTVPPAAVLDLAYHKQWVTRCMDGYLDIGLKARLKQWCETAIRIDAALERGMARGEEENFLSRLSNRTV